MIVFCDTSALMKLYAREAHSDLMRSTVDGAARCLVSLIAWAEMCAAFGLKRRTQQLDEAQVTSALQRLHNEWAQYHRLVIDTPLIEDAGGLALRFGLRAYDSVQLASAQRAHRQLGDLLVFCCFDKQLNTAASALAIPILPQ